MLGARPSTAFATQVWDQTVREIAAHRTRTNLPDTTPGLGPASALDAEHDALPRWEQLSIHIAETRTWLDTHDNTLTVATTRTRSIDELETRAAHLETVFRNAPEDQHTLMGRQPLPHPA